MGFILLIDFSYQMGIRVVLHYIILNTLFSSLYYDSEELSLIMNFSETLRFVNQIKHEFSLNFCISITLYEKLSSNYCNLAVWLFINSFFCHGINCNSSTYAVIHNTYNTSPKILKSKNIFHLIINFAIVNSVIFH